MSGVRGRGGSPAVWAAGCASTAAADGGRAHRGGQGSENAGAWRVVDPARRHWRSLRHPRMGSGSQERPFWDHTANGHGLTGTGGHSYHYRLGTLPQPGVVPMSAGLSAYLGHSQPLSVQLKGTLGRARADCWPLSRRAVRSQADTRPDERISRRGLANGNAEMSSRECN